MVDESADEFLARPPPRGRVVRNVLPFDFYEASGRFVAMPQLVFRPRGILVWGAPPGAALHFYCGNTVQAVASLGHVPAGFFATGDSFARVQELLDLGKDPPAWCTWDTCSLGTVIHVRVVDAKFGVDPDGRSLGPKDRIELLMWGDAIHNC